MDRGSQRALSFHADRQAIFVVVIVSIESPLIENQKSIIYHRFTV